MARRARGSTGPAAGPAARPPGSLAMAGTPAPAPVPGKLYRVADGRVLAGVAAGIAGHLRVPVIAVRLAFVVLLWPSGLGALLYAVFWAVLPVEPTARPARKRDVGQLLVFVALAVGIQLVQLLLGWVGVQTVVGWLVVLVAVGVGVIWHQSDPARRRRWAETMPKAPWIGALFGAGDRRILALRLFGGAALVVTGIIGMTVVIAPFGDKSLGAVLNSLVFSLIAVAGLAVVVAPWIWRITAQLRTEREERIRSQERAEVAALVHDQVLHTLALIQRNAGDVKTVQRLARGQERTLRSWLYKPTGSPTERFAAAIEQAAGAVEDAFAITVDVVVVGDCAVDDRIGAVVAAAREAMVNAAKHAKVDTISLYAEVEPQQLSVFVRDRGTGFDPGAVAPDRHGVRGSIVGRMQRHGGSAEVRSTAGEGTEVRLVLPTKEWSSDE